jgi:hypothetical protein
MDFISDYFLKFSKDCLNIPYAKIKTVEIWARGFIINN